MEKNLLREFKGYKLYEQDQEGAIIGTKELLICHKNDKVAHTLYFTNDNVNSINKAIEAGKQWIKENTIQPPAKPDEKHEKFKGLIQQVKDGHVEGVGAVVASNPERKCRVCGCTENNCQQCIDKTGSPCHWVEEDLCSACVEVKEPVVQINVTDSRASQLSSENIPQEQTQNIPAGDTYFFQQLAMLGNVDLTMRIMKVNGSFTINIVPGVKSKITKPVNITGTPEEFDKGFFTVIMPGLQEVKGLVHNIEEVKKESDKPAVKNTPSPRPKKKSSPKPAKKKAAVKKAKPEKKVSEKKAPAAKKPVVKKEKPVKEEKAPVVAEKSLFDLEPEEVNE